MSHDHSARPDGAPTLEWITAADLALGLVWESGELAELHLDWADRITAAPGPSRKAAALRAALSEYVQGRPPQWPELPLAWGRLTPFARDVLGALQREVGFGRTVTYGELASLAGRPNAARAVGRVMASNPWPLVVPCHRVLGSGGRLHGFSGAGLPMKRHLLRIEGLARPGWEREANVGPGAGRIAPQGR